MGVVRKHSRRGGNPTCDAFCAGGCGLAVRGTGGVFDGCWPLVCLSIRQLWEASSICGITRVGSGAGCVVVLWWIEELAAGGMLMCRHMCMNDTEGIRMAICIGIQSEKHPCTCGTY